MKPGSKRWHRARRRRRRIARELAGFAFQAPEDDPYYAGDVLCLLCRDEMDFVLCNHCGGEGWVNGYEDDPINNGPDDLLRCDDCAGRGGTFWCWDRKCPTSMAWTIFKSYPARIELPDGKVFRAGVHY